MLLLGAGVVMLPRGIVGAAGGVVCIVVAVIWKVVATHLASKAMEKQRREEEEGDG